MWPCDTVFFTLNPSFIPAMMEWCCLRLVTTHRPPRPTPQTSIPPADNLTHSPVKTFWCCSGATGMAAGPIARAAGGDSIKQVNTATIKLFLSACWKMAVTRHTRLELFPEWLSHCFLRSSSLSTISSHLIRSFIWCVFNSTWQINQGCCCKM